jgi:hypothetical protein
MTPTARSSRRWRRRGTRKISRPRRRRDDLFELGGEQADHGLLDVLEHLVDDLVGPDLDVLGVGQLRALRSGGR